MPVLRQHTRYHLISESIMHWQSSSLLVFVVFLMEHFLLANSLQEMGYYYLLKTQKVTHHKCYCTTTVTYAFSALTLLGARNGIRPVKNLSGGVLAWLFSGARCRLAYGPADATATYCLLLQ